MTKEQFMEIRDGDQLDLLTTDFERTGEITKVVRGFNGSGIWVEKIGNKRDRGYIDNPLRVAFWEPTNSKHDGG